MTVFTTRPELHGTFGMVASTHWLASAAGMRLLEAGGNAFDAAAAAGFVLQVVEPHLNGPGGDLPIVLYSADRDEVIVVCGQGPAPAAATTERFRELGLDLVPGTGLLAACVPGAFDAWMQWGKEHASVIVDQGAPLGKTKRAAPGGITDTKNGMTGYVIVKAESHDAAAKLFVNHPHFALFPGDSVEIMECLPLPEP